MSESEPTNPDNSAGVSVAQANIIAPSDHPIRESDIDREALKVLYRLRDAGFKGYLVGGGVRDLYLGRKPKDFDISTDARPGQLRKLFRNSRTIGRRFRLVQVFYRGNKIIEVSTLRSQSEFDIKDSDQVLPANNTFGTLAEDAFRRDLSINSLFYEIETNTIIDYTGGVRDLEDGIVRIVGEPDRRLTRDPVRMLRVIRHAARIGFTIDPPTLAALKVHKDKLNLCPPSRIRDELLKDLGSGCSQAWFELCFSTSVWQALFPFYHLKKAQGDDDGIAPGQVSSALAVLDRLHTSAENSGSVTIPEYMLLATLLLPWACNRYTLPDITLRGPGYGKLTRSIREDLTACIGERLNIKRMAKEAISSLFVNLPNLHQSVQGENVPKWLKKKSYYFDCLRFYGIYQEANDLGLAKVEQFIKEKRRDEPVRQDASAENSGKSHGRGRINPAFSSKDKGVFGLRRRG